MAASLVKRESRDLKGENGDEIRLSAVIVVAVQLTVEDNKEKKTLNAPYFVHCFCFVYLNCFGGCFSSFCRWFKTKNKGTKQSSAVSLCLYYINSMTDNSKRSMVIC